MLFRELSPDGETDPQLELAFHAEQRVQKVGRSLIETVTNAS